MSLTLIAVSLILLLPLLIWYYLVRQEAKTKRRFAEQNLKYVSTDNIFVQIIKGLKPQEESLKLIRKEGKVFGMKMFGTNTITLADPELVQLVLSKEFTNFTNRRQFKFNDPVFDAFLSVVEDEKWKRLRSIVTPTFSSGKLRQMKPRVDETVQNLIKNFQNLVCESNGVVDVKHLYGSFTMDTILQVAFGAKVDSLVEKDNKTIAMARRVFAKDVSVKRLIKLMIIFMVPRLAKLLKISFDDGVIPYFRDFSMEIIKRKREELSNSESYGKATSFLELLLEAEDENEKLLQQNGDTESDNKKAIKFISNDEMIAQCVLFFIAGYDTTASTLSLSAYLLALNPDIQNRLHKEIETVLSRLAQESESSSESDPIALITFESMSKFEYLNAVVNESLRLYPPAPFVERRAAADIQLESGKTRITVKANDTINVPVYSLHRDETQFPDPERFNPDRFMGEPTFHKYAYLPFGSGPRNCVAKSLALLEAKLALLHTVRLFKFSVCEQTRIPMEFYNSGGVTTPKDVILKVEKRQICQNLISN